VLLGFVVLSIFPVFTRSDWTNESIVIQGAISYEEMRSELFVDLSVKPIEILRYTSGGGMQGGKYYLRLIYQNKIDAASLKDVFSAFSLGRNLNYKESPYLPEEVPYTYGVWWWQPKLDPKMKYYQSDMGRSAPLFWVDQEGKTLFVFLGD
jgi:hypothetical protein